MAISRYPEWVPRALSAAELDLDPDSPEFIAACLAVINKSANSSSDAAEERPEVNPGETTAGIAASVKPDNTPMSHDRVSQLETQVKRLGEELAKAHDRLNETTQTVLAHDEARKSLARARHTRSGEVHKAKGARRSSAAPDDTETLQQSVSAILSDRDADNAALREARRREDGVRADLQALETELADAMARHDDTTTALDTAIQGQSAARAELATAMKAAADHESALRQLRQVIADRDQEIVALQLHVLQSEEARAADAAAILDSLDKYRA